MSDGQDKREFSRLRSALDVVLRCDERQVEGSLRNLSMKGLLAVMSDRLEVGTVCQVHVAVQKDAGLVVDAEGKVVRCEPVDGDAFEVAVEVLSILELESFWTLRNWVLYNAPEGVDVERELSEHVGIRRKDEGAIP